MAFNAIDFEDVTPQVRIDSDRIYCFDDRGEAVEVMHHRKRMAACMASDREARLTPDRDVYVRVTNCDDLATIEAIRRKLHPRQFRLVPSD